MKMTTIVAYSNMKYHKSKNILTGIAIILTTLLLFVIPTVGKGMMDVQMGAINKIYRPFHAYYRNVDEATALKLSAHHDIIKYGLRSNIGRILADDATVRMIYMGETGAGYFDVEPVKGTLPVQEDEIAVSAEILEALGVQGDVGDRVKIPYQIERDGGWDYAQEKEFTICGLLEESEANREQKTYMALMSEAFLRNEVPKEQIAYYFAFEVNAEDCSMVNEVEAIVNHIAQQFGIAERDIVVNKEFLSANYIDPAVIPAIVIIMLITMLAGIVTIYSIYYMSMNQRVQEFGKLKAIGATRRQIRQIVLREGLCVAVIAIPIGLLLGTLASDFVLIKIVDTLTRDDIFATVIKEIVKNREVSLHHWWIYLLAIAVAFCTVYLSLLKPMRVASKVSEIEAMRYHDTGKARRSVKKGYAYLTIGRLTARNLADNKKKSAVTIVAMALTGMFLMMVATILSCADPRESASNAIVGQYLILPNIEHNNKEHPELEWESIQQNNPFDEDFKARIERLDGVERVDVFPQLRVTGGIFMEGDYNSIIGIPEEYADEIEKGLSKSKVTYEDLKSGDKAVVDRALVHWYPEVKVGDKLTLTIHDGERAYEKEIEIAGVGDYGNGLTHYQDVIMAKEAVERLSDYNSSCFLNVVADKDYDSDLEKALKELITPYGMLGMQTWKKHYEDWTQNMAIVSGACYAFLGILAVISIMNLINTMLNSVHVRKKELGMMQAIGMSDSQLMKMLQLEGLFYTLGTLAISIGLGSLAGYPLFLYAKRHGMFEITKYHYPLTTAVIVSVTLLLVQLALAVAISKSVKKAPLIERIRFSE